MAQELKLEEADRLKKESSLKEKKDDTPSSQRRIKSRDTHQKTADNMKKSQK